MKKPRSAYDLSQSTGWRNPSKLNRPIERPEDYLCPNCLTPWKCNGPHIPQQKVAA